MNISIRSATALALSTLAAATTPARATTVDVYVYDFDFSINPEGGPVIDASIGLGDTVRWVWAGGFHSATSVDDQLEIWSSTITDTIGFTYEHTFTHTGTFWYFCAIHGFDNFDGTAGGMAGTITVANIPPPVVIGDLNCDGAFNNFDIDPFVLRLIDPAAYDAMFPGCNPANADINQDNAFNNFDIDPFVTLLIN